MSDNSDYLICFFQQGFAAYLSRYLGVVSFLADTIYLSFELKRLKKYADKISDELKERYENIKREIQEKIWE